MARQRKDEPEATEDVRTDASGREMHPWEVDPANQVSRRPADQDAEQDSGNGQPQGTGDLPE